MNMKLLKQLFKIYSPSGKEGYMTKFIKGFCKRIPDAKFEKDQVGNIYITRGESETYPCIVAHLDQVQKIHSKDFKAYETDAIIFGYSVKHKRFEGLGADDKNGIWIALKCLESYDCIKIAFFVGEEIGCVGSSKANMEFFNDVRFVIEPDRRERNDLITSISGMELCSEEFINDTGYARFGYKPTDGLMTDVMELKERGLGVSSINLSCGYYSPHTGNEFVVKKDLLNCLNFVRHIIETCTKIYHHTCEDWYGRSRFGKEYEYWEQYNEVSIIIDDVVNRYPGVTAEMLKERYGYYYDLLEISDFEEILDVYNEETIKTEKDEERKLAV